jgi:hypothetical protein
MGRPTQRKSISKALLSGANAGDLGHPCSYVENKEADAIPGDRYTRAMELLEEALRLFRSICVHSL